MVYFKNHCLNKTSSLFLKGTFSLLHPRTNKRIPQVEDGVSLQIKRRHAPSLHPLINWKRRIFFLMGINVYSLKYYVMGFREEVRPLTTQMLAQIEAAQEHLSRKGPVNTSFTCRCLKAKHHLAAFNICHLFPFLRGS